jgi:hypothetical protein
MVLLKDATQWIQANKFTYWIIFRIHQTYTQCLCVCVCVCIIFLGQFALTGLWKFVYF